MRMIQVVMALLLKHETIERPHRSHCLCDDCQALANHDELKFARSRLNAYRALASEAYLFTPSLTFPITWEHSLPVHLTTPILTFPVAWQHTCLNVTAARLTLSHLFSSVNTISHLSNHMIVHLSTVARPTLCSSSPSHESIACLCTCSHLLSPLQSPESTHLCCPARLTCRCRLTIQYWRRSDCVASCCKSPTRRNTTRQVAELLTG